MTWKMKLLCLIIPRHENFKIHKRWLEYAVLKEIINGGLFTRQNERHGLQHLFRNADIIKSFEKFYHQIKTFWTLTSYSDLQSCLAIIILIQDLQG